MKQASLRDHVRALAAAWAVLIALMLASLGSAYLRLGAGNLIAGLVIALVKSAIVVWLFMRLRTASATLRVVAATALATLLILVVLGSVDYAARPAEPAAFQRPQGRLSRAEITRHHGQSPFGGAGANGITPDSGTASGTSRISQIGRSILISDIHEVDLLAQR